ncbi:penicillin-binding protein 2 [Altererythrobacter aquiaggeris]|uniref:peptidoglycan D,D-transpeptidase FtsI family protein n=1 Tax=Aestuarierythrobacter aquiaggeris TaxID=1898396 RepID=UPI003019BF86
MTAMAVSTALATGRVQLVDIRRSSLGVARLRVLWVLGIFSIVAFMALVRIAFLGMDDRASGPSSLEEQLLPPRGEINDRNGVPLARAFPAYALWYDPGNLSGDQPLVKPARQVATELAAIFPDIDIDEMEEKLLAGRPGYLRRRVLPEDANRIQEIGELALEVPQETDRHYPQGKMAAHVLGYVNSADQGKIGMESVLQERLTDPATRGVPTSLSIDVRVQGALEDELRQGMLSTNAVGAAGIVLDVDSGEVLALASLPEFDPNKIDQAGVDNMFNRVTNQVYELGSTFKPLTVAAAIDAGTIRDFSRPYQASRPVELGGFKIRDSHTIAPYLNAPQSLIHSSNIVTAQIADELGPVKLRQYMIDLGMNERPYIELPAKGFPIWPAGKWPRLRNMTIGYGHGIAVTPLHLASAYAAMVNGGIWRPATLHKLQPGTIPKGRRVFKASTSARMNQLMRMIAVYGTGKNADAPGFRVGGKTGSAEKPGNGGYKRSTLVSTFAAAFPMDRPRFVIIAMLDEPKGTTASSFQRTAAWNAAPVVGRLVPRIGPLLGVMPDETRDIDLSDLEPLVGGKN